MGHYNLFKMRLKFSFVLIFMYCICCINATDEFIASSQNTQSSSALSPFIDILLVCPMQSEPWQCSRLQFGRMLDVFETVISSKNEQLKAEADANYENSVDVRAFSEIDQAKKQKPSSIMNTIENYFNNGINNIMGRSEENEKSKNKKKKPFDIGEAIHIDLSGHGGHNDHGHDHHGGHNHIGLHGIKKKKHGRSLIDEGRGKKKKKKKAMLKLLLVGAIIKAKIELLLKLLATHLQIKFFVIALLGLLVNVARFWFDLKKGNQPQKVIYYEHAQHQHHYDEHDDGWGGGGGGSGGYWKRSLNTNPQSKLNDDDNSYDESGEKHPVDAFYDELQRTKELNREGVLSSPSDPFDYAQTPKTLLGGGVDSHMRAYNKQIPNININN